MRHIKIALRFGLVTIYTLAIIEVSLVAMAGLFILFRYVGV